MSETQIYQSITQKKYKIMLEKIIFMQNRQSIAIDVLFFIFGSAFVLCVHFPSYFIEEVKAYAQTYTESFLVGLNL